MAAVDTRFLCSVLKYFCLRERVWQLLQQGVVTAHTLTSQETWGKLSPDTSQPVTFCIWKHMFTKHLGQKIRSNLLLTCNRGREHISSMSLAVCKARNRWEVDSHPCYRPGFPNISQTEWMSYWNRTKGRRYYILVSKAQAPNFLLILRNSQLSRVRTCKDNKVWWAEGRGFPSTFPFSSKTSSQEMWTSPVPTIFQGQAQSNQAEKKTRKIKTMNGQSFSTPNDDITCWVWLIWMWRWLC